MSGRIGDLAHATRLSAIVQTVQGRIKDTQVAVSTGKEARRYADMAPSVGLLLRSKEQRAAADGFITQNEQIGHRLNAMDGALGNLQSVAERFRNLLVQRLDASTGSSVPLAAEAGQMLDEVAAQLNRKLDDRHLFAGTRTDAPPVVLPTPPPTVSDPTLYYRGDSVKLAVRADEGVELPYGVTADETVFADLIGALGSAQAADPANDRAALEAALSRADRVVEALAAKRGEVATTAGHLESITESQRGSVLYLDRIVSDLEDTDLPAAISRIATDSANLEATYLTISRLNDLSLADYLR